MREIENNAPANVAKILCASKSDLEQSREVTKSEGASFASEHGMKFIEVSTHNKTNLNELFEMVAKEGKKNANLIKVKPPFIKKKAPPTKKKAPQTNKKAPAAKKKAPPVIQKDYRAAMLVVIGIKPKKPAEKKQGCCG